MSQLTTLEKEMFEKISWGCYGDCGLTIEEIATQMEIKIHAASGVLGSLVKKNLVIIEDVEVNSEEYRIVMPILVNEEARGWTYTSDYFSRTQWDEIISETIKSAE